MKKFLFFYLVYYLVYFINFHYFFYIIQNCENKTQYIKQHIKLAQFCTNLFLNLKTSINELQQFVNITNFFIQRLNTLFQKRAFEVIFRKYHNSIPQISMQIDPNQQQYQAFEQFIEDLVGSLDQCRKPQYYVPQQRQITRLKNNLISNSYIIYGSSGSGKTSSVLWAASQQPQIVIVLINCDIQTTQQQFIQALTSNIKAHSKLISDSQTKKKNNIILQNIKFDELNQHIKSSEKKFVIVIKKCEQIAQMKKPTLFYNLLEWINNSSMRQYLGLVFLSRSFHFTDRLEKRVKSRLTAKTITLIRPQGDKIIKIYEKRFNHLSGMYDKTLKLIKQRHRKQSPSLKLKMKWLDKLLKAITDNKHFKQIVHQRINAINNQFLTTMKIAILKSFTIRNFQQLKQLQFNQWLVDCLRDAGQHIGPSYVQNLIKECPLYSVLSMTLISYLGIHNRTPYKISTMYQVYKEKILNNKNFHNLTTIGSSKILFQKSIQKLLDMRIIFFEGQQSGGNGEERYYYQSIMLGNYQQKQISLAIPPQDLRQIILQMQDLPQVIKDLLKM